MNIHWSVVLFSTTFETHLYSREINNRKVYVKEEYSQHNKKKC